MKLLYITTIGSTMGFFKALIKELIDNGNTIDIATNETNNKVPSCYREWGCKVYQIDCSRSPLDKGNIKAIKQIKNMIKNGNYDIVHCHTPIAAACTRIACRKINTRVIYTAHGFHFYKGAPLKNWIIYYPIEWLCAHYTDTLITINKEDYELAKKYMHAKHIEYVPGVGIDVSKFRDTNIDKDKKRKELGIPTDAILYLSVGELNKNKNHESVIRDLAKRNNPNIHYMIAGTGPLKDYLINLSKELNIENQIHLLGYRSDCNELYKICDEYTLPSIREGLNVSLMEAKAAGCKLVASNIRGNTDILNEPNVETFDIKNINKRMREIYG